MAKEDRKDYICKDERNERFENFKDFVKLAAIPKEELDEKRAG